MTFYDNIFSKFNTIVLLYVMYFMAASMDATGDSVHIGEQNYMPGYILLHVISSYILHNSVL